MNKKVLTSSFDSDTITTVLIQIVQQGGAFMKKIVLFMLCALIAFSMSGCVFTYGEVDQDYFEIIQKEDIVDEDFELVDEVTEVEYAFETLNKYVTYIYENEDGDLIEVSFSEPEDDEEDYLYKVCISDATLEDVEYLDDDYSGDSYFKYDDGKKSLENKYETDDEEEYYIYEKKGFLGFKKYEVTEEDE